MFRLQKYDCELAYYSRDQLHITDTLSTPTPYIPSAAIGDSELETVAAMDYGMAPMDKRISLITRQGNHCINDNNPRLNCQGIPVRYQLDPCAFCTPLARLVSGYFTFLDVFVFHPRLLLNATDKIEMRLGLFDEAVDADKEVIISYPLDSVFPLSTCQYMGLRVPCPRKSDVVLTHLYGPNLLLPSRMCNRRYGLWYSV
ncbi:hypothetical protein AHF37_10298 [Paragonimus kellicotti]|nr:hypothetical protein AHF37_10298 [Paragonimus kellicotti]